MAAGAWGSLDGNWGWGAPSAQFGDVSGANRDVSRSDPMSLDLRANHGSGVEFEGEQVCLIDEKVYEIEGI
jgi:hypothetical protein